jgi:hypothetical protein
MTMKISLLWKSLLRRLFWTGVLAGRRSPSVPSSIAPSAPLGGRVLAVGAMGAADRRVLAQRRRILPLTRRALHQIQIQIQRDRWISLISLLCLLALRRM